MGVKAVKMLSQTIVALITLGMAIVSFFASRAKFLTPSQFSIVSILGLLIVIILFINIFLTLYWASKLKAWTFVSIAALLMFIPYISSMVQISFKTPPPFNDKDICVVTYNIHNFKGIGTMTENFRYIAFALAEKDPDIVCFQEFAEDKDFNRDSMASFMRLPYFAVGQNGNNSLDIAVFSRYPIISSESQIYPDTHNGSMFCDIKVKGKIIRLFNCHLQTTNLNQSQRELQAIKHFYDPITFANAVQNIYNTLQINSQKRAKQAEAVNKLIIATKEPIIVCGDLNDTPSSYTYNQVQANLNDGFQDAGRGFGATYRYILNLLRIDYIFHSKQTLTCVNYITEDLDYSDHKPVFAFYKFK
jgi:Metal-dependent hydrolase